MPREAAARDQVPQVMRNQLTRLFGARSAEARKATRTEAEWRRTLRAILKELDRYRRANVHTDSLHDLLLMGALESAKLSLDDESFWPGFVEGLARFALVLMGDYPDHTDRRGTAKSTTYYWLRASRSVHFSQNPAQKVWALREAENFRHLLPKAFWEVEAEFHQQCGYRASRRQFVDWLRTKYPLAYAAMF